MFHVMRNIGGNGTLIERVALKEVMRRLPVDWSAELKPGEGGGRILLISAPDGRSAGLFVKSRQRLSPRDIPNLIRLSGGEGSMIFVVVPFLSPRSRELLREAGASYLDATGNLRIILSEPAVFLEGCGEERDPNRQPRSLRSLKGAAAGRVVRALCDFIPPYGVRTLAQISSTPLGTVSRVVSLLEEEALLSRDARKQVISVDWPALILRWVRDYDIKTSNRVVSFLEPRGLSALAPGIQSLERYAVTGSLAGPDIAPTRLAVLYVDDAMVAGDLLNLVPTDAGANVWLLEPYDEVVFERTQSVQWGTREKQVTLVAAGPSQVVVDLLTSPGRGPQEGEALLEEMKEDENAWRIIPGR